MEMWNIFEDNIPEGLKAIPAVDYTLIILSTVVIYFLLTPFGWEKYQLQISAASFFLLVAIRYVTHVNFFQLLLKVSDKIHFGTFWASLVSAVFVAGILWDLKNVKKSLSLPFYIFFSLVILFSLW